MKPTVTMDMREFNTALQARVGSTRRTLAEVTNQSAFNVAARAMRGTRAANPQQVRAYLGAAMTDNRGSGGKASADPGDKNKANRFGSRHKKGSRMLRRVVLIAQAAFFKQHGHGLGKGKSNKRTKRIRQNTAQQASLFGRNGKLKRNDYGHSLAAKAGKTVMGSDYGEAMRKYAGKLFNKAVRSVGYLSAMWVPILRELAPVAKFKGLAKGLRYAALWKTSSAVGTTSAAREGLDKVTAVLDVTAGNPRMTPNAQAVVRAALQGAIDAEAAEMQRHLTEKLSKP